MKLEATPRDGFTLLELVLTTMLVTALFATTSFAFLTFIGSVEVNREREVQRAGALAALEEMERAIAATERVLQAGPDLLNLSTRYFLSTDGREIVVKYYRLDGDLLRDITDGGTTTTETLAVGVPHFEASYLQINDAFDRETYDDTSTVVVGDDPGADTSVTATHDDLTTLTQTDSDVIAAFNEDRERLEFTSGPGGISSMRVSPRIKSHGLKTETQFTPLTDDAEYRPLVYGEETPDSTNVSVIFKDNHSIMMRTTVGGATIAETTADMSWNLAETYKLKFEIKKDHARLKIEGPDDDEHLPKIAHGDIDSHHVHMQIISPDAQAAWDDVAILYALVELELSVEGPHGTIDYHGGAVKPNR